MSDVDDREHVQTSELVPGLGSCGGAGYAWMNFTNLSRDPCPLSPGPSSSSSASSRMIAIPRPPSLSPSSPTSVGSGPRTQGRRRIPRRRAGRDGARRRPRRSRPGRRVGVPDRVGAGLGDGELEVAERLVRKRTRLGEPAERKPHERDVFGLGRNRQADGGSASIRGRGCWGPP